MNRLTALGPIRFDGRLYQPGAVLEDVPADVRDTLIEAGAAELEAAPDPAPAKPGPRKDAPTETETPPDPPALHAARQLAAATPPADRNGAGWTSAGAPTVPALREALLAAGHAEAARELNAAARDGAWEAATAGEADG